MYVDVESQGRNEVKPSQTSPGGGQSKVPGGEERKNPHQRDQHSQSVRILSPCLILPGQQQVRGQEEIIKQLRSVAWLS